MKQVFRLSLSALMFVCLCAASAPAQTPTPDSSFTQLTSSSVDAFAGGISGNGRFVVFESTGNLATLQPGESARGVDNADGNREIFLYDYAQRRTFQITNTTSARKDATKPDVDLTKRPPDFSNVEVEVSTNRPVISRDGRWIVFSSNAATPFNFNGSTNRDALRADGNQEVFLYRIPDVAAADLTSGADPGFIDLRQDAFTRVTNTPASRLPQAGTATAAPFVADDNRLAQLNDRASRLVFVSTRNLTTVNGRTNADANPEVFVWNRPAGSSAGTFSQLTNTSTTSPAAPIFNDNPTISGDTTSDTSAENPVSVIAFISNAASMTDSTNANAAANNADGNAEIFVTTFNGSTDGGIRQATRTRRGNAGDIVNLLNPGRRLSRNGNLLAFESVATDPKADSSTNQEVRGVFVYNIGTDTFIPVGPRAVNADLGNEDVLRFPVFTGDSSRLVFVSDLNFTPSGTRVEASDNTGLNPDPARYKQIYSVPVPEAANTPLTFTRLSNTRAGQRFASLQPFVSNTTERVVFSFASAELGGGNADFSTEVFYLNTPPAPSAANDTPAATSALAYFTGATQREVVTPSASPTPTPSPAPSATPITGLAPGMIGIVRTTAASGALTLAPATSRVECPPDNANCDIASESHRRPTLPVELGGVSLSVNNAAAGLYFVSPTEIQFVVPPGLTSNTATATSPVVININAGGSVRTVRSVLQITLAQPDIFSSTNGALGRARVFNVTRTGTMMPEPSEGFGVTTPVPNADGTVTNQPTILRIFLTGVRNITATSAVSVMLKDRTLSGGEIVAIRPTDTPGMDQIDVRLRADLAGLGDSELVVSITTGGLTFTSRPAATAPRIRIQ